MTTSIRGTEAPWPPEIQAKWDAIDRPPGRITRANYFTPRPAVDEYDQGSTAEGFTYVLYDDDEHRPHVYQVLISTSV